MKVTLVNYSDVGGGAARAAYRLHRGLLDYGVDSRMRVAIKGTDDHRVDAPLGKARKALSLLRAYAGGLPMCLQTSMNPIQHSLASLPSNLAAEFQRSKAEIVHLHWICNDLISIADIGRIRKPVLWTLHDSWAFCGSEHHPDGLDDERFVNGYAAESPRNGHSGLDLDGWTWRRKQRAWQRALSIVAPSRWLAENARRSLLMRDWPVEVIPNPLPVNTFKPWPKALAREVCGLPPDVPLVLFGAIGGTNNPIKGWDLLSTALRRLAITRPDCQAVVLGQLQPEKSLDVGMPIHYAGRLQDDAALALLFAAVDVVVIPSRIENLPQVGTEALACGTPVVAFDCSGMPDVVEHLRTGYLARPYDPADLAVGIFWVLEDETRRLALGVAARDSALKRWAPEVVVPQYITAYQVAIDANRGAL